MLGGQWWADRWRQPESLGPLGSPTDPHWTDVGSIYLPSFDIFII